MRLVIRSENWEFTYPIGDNVIGQLNEISGVANITVRMLDDNSFGLLRDELHEHMFYHSPIESITIINGADEIVAKTCGCRIDDVIAMEPLTIRIIFHANHFEAECYQYHDVFQQLTTSRIVTSYYGSTLYSFEINDTIQPQRLTTEVLNTHKLPLTVNNTKFVSMIKEVVEKCG